MQAFFGRSPAPSRANDAPRPIKQDEAAHVMDEFRANYLQIPPSPSTTASSTPAPATGTPAWQTLAILTLTNSVQFHFDTSAIGAPAGFYRLVQVSGTTP
jgi:hypothetical protein